LQILERFESDGHHWRFGSSVSEDHHARELLGLLKTPLFLWAKEAVVARQDQEWESPWNVEKSQKKKMNQESDQREKRKKKRKSKRRSARIHIRFQFLELR
jgi:hypothetical protein